MIKEVWKPVKDYEELYEVSSLGNVRSITRYKKILKPGLVRGYPHITLYNSKNKKNKNYNIHRLVAETFIDNPNKLPQVNQLKKLLKKLKNKRWLCDTI